MPFQKFVADGFGSVVNGFVVLLLSCSAFLSSDVVSTASDGVVSNSHSGFATVFPIFCLVFCKV